MKCKCCKTRDVVDALDRIAAAVSSKSIPANALVLTTPLVPGTFFIDGVGTLTIDPGLGSVSPGTYPLPAVTKVTGIVAEHGDPK